MIFVAAVIQLLVSDSFTKH